MREEERVCVWVGERERDRERGARAQEIKLEKGERIKPS